MKIRRFYGRNIRSALRQVTEEFGDDAAILSNKKVSGGVEVIAALDYDEDLMPTTVIEPSKNTLNTTESSSHRLPVSSEIAAQNQAKKIRQEDLAVVAAMDQKAENKTDDKIDSPKLSPDLSSLEAIKQPLKKQSLEWSLDPSLQAMKEELCLMRSMMSEQLKGIAWNRFSESDPVSAMVMRRLTKLGIANDVLNLLLTHIKKETDAECAWQHILAILAKSLPVANGELVENGGIFAFMGPTGVGKTTTIAKLAARYVIKHGVHSVGLMTTDNYRISAQEQLASFGRILQLPTIKVNNEQSLKGALQQFSDKRLVLIDTAGVSGADSHLVQPLKMLQSCRKPIHKLLLMSAASQGRVLQQSLSLFEAYSPKGIIITKLDEAASLGELLSVIIRANIPAFYTTDGQKIPEDIRIARSHHLISKAVWLAEQYAQKTDDWNLAQSLEQMKSA